MREQTTIRLTVRPTDELDKLIREEAARRGASINQTMLYILNKIIQESESIIFPRSFS